MNAFTYQLTGMIVVFGCLVLLCVILSISGAVATRLDAKRKAQEAAAKAAAAAAAPAPVAPQPVAVAPELTPAQVAALADHHYLISKGVADGRTVSRLHEVSDDARVAELMRMLGTSGATAEAHARGLLLQE